MYTTALRSWNPLNGDLWLEGGCLGSRIACIFMKAQILTWAYKLLTSCVSTYAHPSVLEQGHYADRECLWEQVGRKEDLPGNVKIFSSPKETTKSSIPNVEYSGALSNKEADLYSVFQAWLHYAFSASFHLVKTHFNSILLAINILVQNVIPSSSDTLFSDLRFPFIFFQGFICFIFRWRWLVHRTFPRLL